MDFANQADFYPQAKRIADTAVGFTWGPNVNVTYSTYKDAFGKAVSNHTSFAAAVDQMQEATIGDLRKNGFKIAN